MTITIDKSEGRDIFAKIDLATNLSESIGSVYIRGINGEMLKEKRCVRDEFNQAVKVKYYYYPDRIGSVYMVCDEKGMMLEKSMEDNFGSRESGVGNRGLSKYGLSSNMFDSETGLYYFAARWYDPKVGRFLEMDPVISEGGLINMYDYCGNNPGNVVDRYGEIFEMFGFDSDQDFVNGLTYDILHKNNSRNEAEEDYNADKTGNDYQNNYCSAEMINDIVNGVSEKEIIRKIANDGLPENLRDFEPIKINVSTPNAKYAGYFVAAVGVATIAAGAILTIEALHHGPLGGFEVMGAGFMVWAGAWMTGIGIETIKSAKELEKNEK